MYKFIIYKVCVHRYALYGLLDLLSSIVLVLGEFYAHPSAGDVRLLRGESQSSGILEVYYDGLWQRPCVAGFNRTGADTVCQQLGYTSSMRDPQLVTRSVGVH